VRGREGGRGGRGRGERSGFTEKGNHIKAQCGDRKESTETTSCLDLGRWVGSQERHS
jgi:hypothetical protein